MSTQRKFVVTVTEDQVRIVGAALMELPAKISLAIINDLERQIQAQMPKKAEDKPDADRDPEPDPEPEVEPAPVARKQTRRVAPEVPDEEDEQPPRRNGRAGALAREDVGEAFAEPRRS